MSVPHSVSSDLAVIWLVIDADGRASLLELVNRVIERVMFVCGSFVGGRVRCIGTEVER